MNPVISTFFQNYGLLPDFDAFRAAQRDLMLHDVHIESRDHRGWQVLDGVDAYVESVREWSQFYGNSDDRGFEPTLDDGTDVEVKVTGTIVFSEAYRGRFAHCRFRPRLARTFRSARGAYRLGPYRYGHRKTDVRSSPTAINLGTDYAI